MKPTNSSSVNQYLEITVESVSSEITIGSAVDMLTSHVTNPEAHLQYLPIDGSKHFTGDLVVNGHLVVDDVMGIIAHKVTLATDPIDSYEAATKQYVDNSITAVDHGSISGLTDDDHPQYLLADGSRNLNGDLVVTGALTVDSMLGIVAHQITLVQPGDQPSEVPTKSYVDSRIWKGTQAQYDALGAYDPDIIYVVTG